MTPRVSYEQQEEILQRLHQCMEDVDRVWWAPMFALAAAAEIRRVTPGDHDGLKAGFEIITSLMATEVFLQPVAAQPSGVQ